jgi:hypothetical protein
MIAQTFSRGASIRELDETENTCSDAKGGSRDELDILFARLREFVEFTDVEVGISARFDFAFET